MRLATSAGGALLTPGEDGLVSWGELRPRCTFQKAPGDQFGRVFFSPHDVDVKLRLIGWLTVHVGRGTTNMSPQRCTLELLVTWQGVRS